MATADRSTPNVDGAPGGTHTADPHRETGRAAGDPATSAATTISALVARGAGRPPTVERVVIPAPGPGQVRVAIRAAGVCHSDLSMIDGTLAPAFPLVLGHEAAGIVTELGAGVDRLSGGERVVLNWSPACRACWHCTAGRPWFCETSGRPSAARGTTADGTPLHVTLGLGALAEEVVVSQHAVIPVPAAVPFEQAALLGCAVLTGVGAVRNTARVAAGESVVVIGLGGVGLSAVLAAREAGAAQIIAVDVAAAKGSLASAAGATDFLLSDESLVRAIRERTDGRGADHAFECVGRAKTIETAWRSVRRGGGVIVVGMGGRDDVVGLGALDVFHSGRVLRSSVYGAADPDRDVPALAEEVLAGTLDIRPLITHRLALAEAPSALDRLTRGEGARSVVSFPT
ncbi:alcohol dehydrogenase catalytic domain-containing protein [Actinoalloteichus hymeniacidonis]|uniref:Zn-dependent alcohol dehydrogenase, class III n=1 Tax=Actinoalloteichus hymeniacidonis TaxID=340345 RepID=A0AAC9HPR0_9PSEU|nr:alcohol dehydrogenase catalytic domain-containing protein [Actinoalloteichus hymeniacidonis]AOS63342.1 Zn-dependent alcohol dehydrogenase, class III [Actinoalloteichus hymeniacidonis]MBB5908618.1 S-(hydroxymethyl)glutathione dehydrogenase/alcohol dehydrogenase [Actinoalloteichus hymeniacidonis]